MRLACISIDLDELPHYCAIHGLPESALAEGGATAVYRLAAGRFLEALDRAGVKGTLFCVGRDLGGDAKGLLRQAAAAGHELGNHTHWHDYALSTRSPAEISADIARGAEAIAAHAGAQVLGFRAPGYTFTAPMYAALCAQGYAYGSSVFPAAPYYLAKAAVLARMRLRGEASRSILDTPRVLAAPRLPYHPDPADPYRAGSGPVQELPMTVEPLTRFPFIGTFTVGAPGPAAMALYAAVRRVPFLNFELHGADFLDQTDGAGPALAAAQPDLQVPASRKLARFDELLRAIRGDFEVVTLLQASGRLL